MTTTGLGARPCATRRDAWTTVERWAAIAAAVAIGANFTVISGLTAGCCISLALAPLWLFALRHYRGGLAFLGIGLLMVGSGLALGYSAPDVLTDESLRGYQSWTALGLVINVGALLWARQRIGTRAVAFGYGFGLLATTPLHLAANAGNVWKFVLCVPISLLLLSAAVYGRRPKLLEVVGLALLAVASAAFDSRSFLGVCAICVVLVMWSSRPQRAKVIQWWGWSVASLGLLALAVYQLAQELLVSGLLGANAQQRTEQQIQMAGSLILGGRPELMATLSLFRLNPTGYGAGVTADVSDINTAKLAMSTLGYAPNNGYVDNYMFGTGVELHSCIGDLWARGGLAGLAFALLVVVLLLRGLIIGLQRRTLMASGAIVAVWSLWSLFFGPLLSAVPPLTIALALNFVPRTHADELTSTLLR